MCDKRTRQIVEDALDIAISESICNNVSAKADQKEEKRVRVSIDLLNGKPVRIVRYNHMDGSFSVSYVAGKES